MVMSPNPNPFHSPAYFDFKRLLENLIEDAIQRRRRVFYSELMDAIFWTTGVRLANRHPWLSYALGDLVREDFANKKPLRSSIVHSKAKRMPSDGFFELSKELGIEVKNRRAYADDCMQAVFGK